MPFIVGERRHTDEGCRERRGVVKTCKSRSQAGGGVCNRRRDSDAGWTVPSRHARTANLSIASPALPPARGSQPSTRSAPSEGSIASPSLTQSTHLSPQWQTRSLPTTSPSWPLIVTVCHRTCPHIPMDQHMQYVPRKVSTSRFYTQVHRPNPLPVIRRHGSMHVIPLDHNQSATEPQNENPNRQHDRPSGP